MSRYVPLLLSIACNLLPLNLKTLGMDYARLWAWHKRRGAERPGMDNDDFLIGKRKAHHAQGRPRTGKSPGTSGSFVRARPRTGRFNARGRGRVALSGQLV